MWWLSSPGSTPQSCYGGRRRPARWTGSSADLLPTWRGCCQERSDECLTKKKKDRHSANARRGWWLTCSSNHLSFRRRSWSRSARAWRPHLHGWSPSAGLGAARPAGPGNNRGGSPVVPVRHWLPSRSWRGARWARLCARTFSLRERSVYLHEHKDQHEAERLRSWSLTCQVLLNVRALLQELGPSEGPSVENGHVLVHHFLVGLVVVSSLKAIGVNPAATVYTLLQSGSNRGTPKTDRLERLWTHHQKAHLNPKILSDSTGVIMDDISAMKQL